MCALCVSFPHLYLFEVPITLFSFFLSCYYTVGFYLLQLWALFCFCVSFSSPFSIGWLPSWSFRFIFLFLTYLFLLGPCSLVSDSCWLLSRCVFILLPGAPCCRRAQNLMPALRIKVEGTLSSMRSLLVSLFVSGVLWFVSLFECISLICLLLSSVVLVFPWGFCILPLVSSSCVLVKVSLVSLCLSLVPNSLTLGALSICTYYLHS